MIIKIIQLEKKEKIMINLNRIHLRDDKEIIRRIQSAKESSQFKSVNFKIEELERARGNF